MYNPQGDVIGLFDDDLDVVVEYAYDSWGNLVSMTDNSDDGIGNINPFRYRGYYYDSETGMYYLNSRYYHPEIGRFINADGYVQTGQGLLDKNMFAYCGNNPVNRVDPTGQSWADVKNWVAEKWNSVKETIKNTYNAIVTFIENDFSVQHDVPLYDQGDRNLCWAYSQIMVEDSLSGTVSTQEEADARARALGEQQHGAENWNSPGIPTNRGSNVGKSLLEIAIATLDGPVYARYDNANGVGHLVVITGVDLKNQTISINNPWGFSGEITYDEFSNGFPGTTSEHNFTLDVVWDVES